MAVNTACPRFRAQLQSRDRKGEGSRLCLDESVHRSRENAQSEIRNPQWGAALVFVALLFLPSYLSAQRRPLKTEDVDLVTQGRVRAEFGLEFLHDQRFSLSGLEGNLTRVGVVALNFGLGGYADLRVAGVIRDFLSVSRRRPPVIAPDFSGSGTSDFGDLVLATRIRLALEQSRRPAVGLKFAVQLPNASNESGLGTDVTNFHAMLLLSKRLGRAEVLGNLGLAILGSAVTPNSQSDMFTYGLATSASISQKINLVAEIHGRQGPERIGNENQAQVRVGARIRAAGLRWDLATVVGLREFDPDRGLVLGVTYEFQAFQRKKSPKVVKP